jgi:hypothetical protein
VSFKVLQRLKRENRPRLLHRGWEKSSTCELDAVRNPWVATGTCHDPYSMNPIRVDDRYKSSGFWSVHSTFTTARVVAEGYNKADICKAFFDELVAIPFLYPMERHMFVSGHDATAA